MKRTSTKPLIIKVVLVAVSFVVTIALIRSIQEKGLGDLFGSGPSIDQEKELQWCEAPVEYVRISSEEEEPERIEVSEDESRKLCHLKIMGYQPSEVVESAFLPLLLVRFEGGGQQVVESDGEGHYRLQGMIFRSTQLNDWIEEH